MRASLIFPPATDPRAPHLALPYLAAVLRHAGVPTQLLDADIGGLCALLRPDRIAAGVESLKRKLRSSGGPDRQTSTRLVTRGEALVEEMPGALEVLRDKQRFYDANRFHAAREAILDAVELASAAAGRPIRYNLCPIQYEIEGVDEQRLADLISATGDPRTNLFEAYWESDLFPAIDAWGPDLVGISIVNRQQIVPGLTMARRLRARGSFVVLGGTVFTKFASGLLRLPTFFEHFADGVVAYEGETAIVELAAQLEAARDFAKVPNFLFLDTDRVRAGATHVEDLDGLPAPDFEGLPLDQYLSPEPVLPILVGKGCYFNECKFCDIPFINHVSKKPYRVRSPERIVLDILELNRRFGCRHFEITDEALPPRLLEKLADALLPHRRADLSFTGYARLEPGFTPGVLSKLAAMGMRKLFFGLESGDQATLDHMRKGIRLEDVRPVLSRCREAGILFHVFSMIGFPEETEASARKTLRFFEDNVDVIEHPGNSFDIHPFGLELRTAYFAELGRLGVVVPDELVRKDFVIGVRSGWSNTRGLSQDDVARLVGQYNDVLKRIFSRFHNHPVHLWPGFEEYAVLYADHYRERDFPFRTALPDADDPRPFMLSWTPAVVISREGDWTRVSSRWQTIEVDQQAFRVFSAAPRRTVRELLVECIDAKMIDAAGPVEPRIRAVIDAMIGTRLLQIEMMTEGETRGEAGRRTEGSTTPIAAQAIPSSGVGDLFC